jgi:hypothetical protein
VLRLFTGLLEKPVDLAVDTASRLDLLGDGHPKLVDPLESFGLVDDDVAGQGEMPAVRDERLQTLDQDDDVYRTSPPWAFAGLPVVEIIVATPGPTGAW